jgi:hypothetical protein
MNMNLLRPFRYGYAEHKDARTHAPAALFRCRAEPATDYLQVLSPQYSGDTGVWIHAYWQRPDSNIESTQCFHLSDADARAMAHKLLEIADS